MTDIRYTLSKEERLSKKNEIDLLFAKGQSFIAYPLRVVYYISPEEEVNNTPVSILVSVSKKRFKHAVDRNAVKRLVREAYRIRKNKLFDSLTDTHRKLNIGFIYLSKDVPSFKDIEKSITKTIRTLLEKTQ